MKKIYTLFLGIVMLCLQSNAQCPTPSGMVATPINYFGYCFINVQFAIPNSTVFIFNGSGIVYSGIASNTGNVVISYPCGSNPITSITSVIGTTPNIQRCDIYTIAQLTVLPIKLTSFTASLNNSKTVTLKWDVEWELNNDKYEVERSFDGINFTKLSTLNSYGNTISKQSYNFEDIAFTQGTTAFYRLKQTDLDGKFSYSKIVYVNDKASVKGNYALFPNPLSNSSNNIQIKEIAATDVTYKNIRVTDLAGRNISYQIVGANAIELHPSTKPGIYLIQVKDKTLKLIKQ